MHVDGPDCAGIHRTLSATGARVYSGMLGVNHDTDGTYDAYNGKQYRCIPDGWFLKTTRARNRPAQPKPIEQLRSTNTTTTNVYNAALEVPDQAVVK